MGRPTTEKILKNPEIFRNSHFATGLWRALVVRVDDPENRGRLKVRILKRHPAPAGSSTGVDATTLAGRVASVLESDQIQVAEGNAGVPTPPGSFDGIPDDALPWAEPCFPFGGKADEGFMMLPTTGSTVWVAYEQGWTGAPVWLGAWYGGNELPVEFTDPENIRLIKTPAGHMIVLDDTPGGERIFIGTQDTNHTIRFVELNDGNETLILQNALGATQQVMKMDLPNTTISVLNGILQKILIEGATQRVTVENNPNQQVIIDGVAQTVTIKNNSTVSIVLTATTVVITAGGTVVTIDSGTGTATMTLPGDLAVEALGDVSLGTGAVKGVCLDSLLTVILAMVSVFNSHTHSGGAPPDQSQVGPVFGTDSSATVLAKA